MVTKSKPGQKKGKVKVGKLKLNKETVKVLSSSDRKQLGAGLLIHGANRFAQIAGLKGEAHP